MTPRIHWLERWFPHTNTIKMQRVNKGWKRNAKKVAMQTGEERIFFIWSPPSITFFVCTKIWITRFMASEYISCRDCSCSIPLSIEKRAVHGCHSSPWKRSATASNDNKAKRASVADGEGQTAKCQCSQIKTLPSTMMYYLSRRNEYPVRCVSIRDTPNFL